MSVTLTLEFAICPPTPCVIRDNSHYRKTISKVKLMMKLCQQNVSISDSALKLSDLIGDGISSLLSKQQIRGGYQHIFLVSAQNHMLWILIRSTFRM